MSKSSLSEVRTLLRRSDARQDAILRASLDAIVIIDHDGRFTEFNPAAERMFGYRRDQVIGQLIGDFIIPERMRERHRIGMARYVATGVGTVINKRLEMPALRADGTEFPVELAIVPVEGSNPPAFVGFLRDITESKETERRRQWLLEELTHRSRNLFTVVQAIVARTLRRGQNLDEARDVLGRRINALARSHAALAENPDGASVAHIISQELEGFSNRVDASGPQLMVNARAAQALALILHELSTNASKYGALSVDTGRVTITWEVAGAHFHFQWREHGGPLVTSPTRKGFGSVVLEQLAAAELKGTPELRFETGGLVYRIENAESE